jgi:hypothetical protein
VEVIVGLPNAYRVILSIPDQKLVLLPSDEAIDIASIKRGILFILAKWSGASQLAFRALNKALASLPELDGLYLYVADTDCEKTQQFFLELGDNPAGAGETYWVLEGRIRRKLSGYTEESLSTVRDNTLLILTPAQLAEDEAERQVGPRLS